VDGVVCIWLHTDCNPEASTETVISALDAPWRHGSAIDSSAARCLLSSVEINLSSYSAQKQNPYFPTQASLHAFSDVQISYDTEVAFAGGSSLRVKGKVTQLMCGSVNG
jgi:hypothetical protein